MLTLPSIPSTLHASVSIVLSVCCGVAAYAADPFSRTASGDCNASRADFLVGQLYTQEIGEEAKVASNAKTFRVLRPYAPESADRNLNRLRIQLDENDIILGFLCG